MMEGLSFRQVHLDFHTSELIQNIGNNFSKKQFQDMLKLGHVSSITVFSKCHHGWAYHPSKANETHPGLSFDLLKEMIDAAHEIGVKTPVYLSAGLDEKMARRHSDWLIRKKNEETTWARNFMEPGYHEFCLNSPYLDYLLPQIEEVVRNYDADGIFLDIVGVREFCRCQHCVESARREGIDPRDDEAMKQIAERTYANYTKRVEELIHGIRPELKIFHNGGHIRRGRRDLANMNTHLELESLPTGGWGYDHFPLSARYAQGLGMEFLGMTGKFHTTWGEFGGYKHPNALRYEAALSIANGAKCSIGDQLHPEGLMDETTYRIIGAAYSEVEQKEAWCDEVKAMADMALLSLEAVSGNNEGHDQTGNASVVDAGAVRMLLEGHYLFDVIDLMSDFSQYKVIILPDKVSMTPQLMEKLEEFFHQGGKIIATGESGLNPSKTAFELGLGDEYIGENKFRPDYFKPHFPFKQFSGASLVMYSQGQQIKLNGGKELGIRQDSYFNREVISFCSHQHTPNSMNESGPGMVLGENGIYIAWNVFEDYALKGSLGLKEMVRYALDLLLKEKTLTVNLPSGGVTTLMKQEKSKRYINHLLYASPVKRGKDIEVIEDILPVYDIKVSLKLHETIKRVYLAPSQEELPFEYTEGRLHYSLPRLE